MSNIQIVTDSTAYLTKEEIKNYNIKVVSLMVNFQGKEDDEGLPGEFEKFFNALKESQDFPTTSQPPTGAFAAVFQEAIDQGKEVIAITISSKLSGTYNSAIIGAEMIDAEKISVVDSQTSVASLKHMVIQAQKLANEGKTRQEILHYLEEQKRKMGIYLTVDTLEYLKRGGRLSTAQAVVGSLLNIKPIIQLEDGILQTVGKARGKKKALDMLIANIPQEVKYVYIPHILNEEGAKELQAVIKERHPQAKVELEVLGPVIGAHLGPKAMGACYLW
ncbi:DegV family protein [Irregularibacter muris]|uniref:DegV family protein n=1 Tax=Irregularibacter muris TaxID=1796619 RepID=A0AAE3HGE8_9FIRM|nr:DegV family protein [Irregularibacter muris]MCR1899696.1 DegV family protein [Irregularibacter muris]